MGLKSALEHSKIFFLTDNLKLEYVCIENLFGTIFNIGWGGPRPPHRSLSRENRRSTRIK